MLTYYSQSILYVREGTTLLEVLFYLKFDHLVTNGRNDSVIVIDLP